MGKITPIYQNVAVQRDLCEVHFFEGIAALRRLSSFISEYLRERITPSAPPRNAA